MEGPNRLGAGIAVTVSLAALSLYLLAHPSALPAPTDGAVVDSRLVQVLLGDAAASQAGAGVRHILGALLGAAAVGAIYGLLRRTRVDRSAALWLTVAFAFGTAHWWAAAAGDAAGVGHVAGVLAALAALALGLDGRWPLLSGMCLGIAAAARLPMIMLLPLLLALYVAAPPAADEPERGPPTAASPGSRRAAAARRWLVTAGPLLAGLLVPLFVLGVAPSGGYGIHNLPAQLHTALLRSFDLTSDAPWFRPSWAGAALLLTTPIYAWLGRARSRAPAVVWGWLSVALIGAVTAFSPYLGAPQFGYRPALDAAPALFLLLAYPFRTGLGRGARLAVVAGVAVNAYGMIVIGVLDPPFAA